LYEYGKKLSLSKEKVKKKDQKRIVAKAVSTEGEKGFVRD